eukprot:TRINITY_DN27125_c0_g1_i1.p1 TRINITY_DN27125_c0_g1~~TRINITY_DN27125_c0_g1_i1.p1  ORF type:complete len:148 (+),score=13.56 TRINITY_DN27125_c0_g1_i1:47-490(+)
MPHPAQFIGCKAPHPAEMAAGSSSADGTRKNYHAFAFGNKVTGIGLRAQIARVAEARHVTGWAQNLSDHTLEVVGNGPSKGMKTLSAYVRRQSGVSRVAEQFQPTHHKGAYHHFYTVGHHGHATSTGKSWPYQADYVGDIPARKLHK